MQKVFDLTTWIADLIMIWKRLQFCAKACREIQCDLDLWSLIEHWSCNSKWPVFSYCSPYELVAKSIFTIYIEALIASMYSHAKLINIRIWIIFAHTSFNNIINVIEIIDHCIILRKIIINASFASIHNSNVLNNLKFQYILQFVMCILERCN